LAGDASIVGVEHGSDCVTVSYAGRQHINTHTLETDHNKTGPNSKQHPHNFDKNLMVAWGHNAQNFVKRTVAPNYRHNLVSKYKNYEICETNHAILRWLPLQIASIVCTAKRTRGLCTGCLVESVTVFTELT
jgi:hypothetical protein